MEVIEMRKSSSFAALIFIVIRGIGGGLAFAMYRATANMESAWIGVIAFVIALVVSLAIIAFRIINGTLPLPWQIGSVYTRA